MRLDRYLARCGAASRRACKEHIQNGFATVNGRVIREPSYLVGPDDKVMYLGEGVSLPRLLVAALNKRLGYESTMSEETPHRAITGLMSGLPPGTVPCGRLDIRTGGLLLLTNDGDLAHRLTHPRWQVPREYLLTLSESPSPSTVSMLEGGVDIGEGEISRPTVIRRVGSKALSMVLTTGRNREVRRLARACGLNLLSLQRTAYGPIKLSGIERGRYRILEHNELNALYATVDLEPPRDLR